MSKKSKAVTLPTNEANPTTERSQRRTYAIAVNGIETTNDLCKFCSAMISDITSGDMDLHEASVMGTYAGKLIGLANLQLRLGLTQKIRKGSALLVE